MLPIHLSYPSQRRPPSSPSSQSAPIGLPAQSQCFLVSSLVSGSGFSKRQNPLQNEKRSLDPKFFGHQKNFKHTKAPQLGYYSHVIFGGPVFSPNHFLCFVSQFSLGRKLKTLLQNDKILKTPVNKKMVPSFCDVRIIISGALSPIPYSPIPAYSTPILPYFRTPTPSYPHLPPSHISCLLVPQSGPGVVLVVHYTTPATWDAHPTVCARKSAPSYFSRSHTHRTYNRERP